eukprot:scaffold178936_cov18-Tisochrysis_lutea.AAC.1
MPPIKRLEAKACFGKCVCRLPSQLPFQHAHLLHELARFHHVARQLLQSRDGHPTGRMVGVGLDDGLEQQPCLLDVGNVCITLERHGLQ